MYLSINLYSYGNIVTDAPYYVSVLYDSHNVLTRIEYGILVIRCFGGVPGVITSKWMWIGEHIYRWKCYHGEYMTENSYSSCESNMEKKPTKRKGWRRRRRWW